MTRFGADQMARFLRGDGASERSIDAAREAIESQMSQAFQWASASGVELQSNLFGPSGDGVAGNEPGQDSRRIDHIEAAQSCEGEEVFVRMGKGIGHFSPGKDYITLDMKESLLDGTPDGMQQGVWHRQFATPEEIMVPPPPPTGPMNIPVGPVPHRQPQAQTKVFWQFADGSSLTAEGPAAVSLIALSDGSYLFLVTTAQIITGGTGRYSGAAGLTQSLGATLFPPGTDIFSSGDVGSFPAIKIDTYRVIRPNTFPVTVPQAPNSEYLYKSNYVALKGANMHYLDVGQGDPFLLLHGSPTWSYLWRNVIPELTSLGRCVAPDFIGMGYSDKPPLEYTLFQHFDYLREFVEKLDLRNITLVMHDQGGTLGLMLASAYPERIKALAFAEIMLKPYSSFQDFPADLREPFRAFRSPSGMAAIVFQNVFIEGVLPGGVMRRSLTEQEMEFYRQPFADPPSRMVIKHFVDSLPIGGVPGDVATAVAQYSGWLRASRLPKLLIRGEPGVIITDRETAWAEKYLTNLTVVSIGPGRHFLQEEDPVAFGQAVAEWTRGCRHG